MSGRWQEPRQFVLGGPLTPAVKTLLIANVAVFLFQYVAQGLAQVRIDRIFGLVPYDVTHHLFLWQLVTYMFLHGGIWHIGFNMLALWMFCTDGTCLQDQLPWQPLEQRSDLLVRRLSSMEVEEQLGYLWKA